MLNFEKLKLIMKELNTGHDRCILIGRNALNFLNVSDGRGCAFSTMDYDLACPTVIEANECHQILNQYGFVKSGAKVQPVY